MLRRVKVISLLQPWATLMVLGLKRIETRSWNTKHRGELFIHASASDKGVRFIDKNPNEPISRFLQSMNRYNQPFEFGKILGSVDLLATATSDALMMNEVIRFPDIDDKWLMTDQEKAFGDYSPGRYGWMTNNNKLLETFIPAKGKLSIWEFDLPDIAA